MTVTLDRPYCTLDQVQRFIGNTDTSKVDQIKDAINRASRFIDEITGLVFYKKTITDIYIPGTGGGNGWDIRRAIPGKVGGGLLFCPWRPIVSITSIVEDGVTLVENDDFYVISDSGIIERADGNWDEDPRGIKISAVFGYDAATTTAPAATQPQDITEFAVEIAGRRSGLFTRNVEQQDGSVMAFYETTIPKWIVDRLATRALSL